MPGHQTLVALLDHGLRHLVWHGRSRRSLADRILEGESGREARLVDDREGVLEVVLCLAGEPHNDVGCDGSVWNLLSHAIEDPQELLASITAPHSLQNPI